MTDKYEALRKAAEAANEFGWEKATYWRENEPTDAESDYIAIASPSNILELLDELEALKVDAERLDFLDRMNAALNSHYRTNYRWKLILSPMITRLMVGAQRNGYVGDVDLNDANFGPDSHEGCRAAIDAAREQK